MADTEHTRAMQMEDCQGCNAIAFLKAHGFWFHQGEGLFGKSTDILRVSPQMTISHLNVFSKAFESCTDHKSVRIPSPKPSGCVWFSQGTWLTNRFYESKKHKHHHSVDGASGCIISQDQLRNILHIATRQELEDFTEKYGAKELDGACMERKEKIRSLLSHMGLTDCLCSLYKKVEVPLDIQALKGTLSFVRQFMDWFYTNPDCLRILEDIVRTEVDKLAEKLEIDRSQIESCVKTHHQCSCSVRDKVWDSEMDVFSQFNRLTNYFIFPRILELESTPDTFQKRISNIDWCSVRTDYAGIAFHFAKVKEIGPVEDGDFERFYWFHGWDTESLVLFNEKLEESCRNTVYPCVLES